MYEYEIMNKITKERYFIWGYNWNDALTRGLYFNPDEWECLHCEYVD